MNRPTLTLKKRDGTERFRARAGNLPAPVLHNRDEAPAPAAEPDPHTVKLDKATWERLAAALPESGPRQGFVRKVLRSALRARERRDSGTAPNLVLAAAPADLGDRLAKAAEARGHESVSELAIAVLEGWLFAGLGSDGTLFEWWTGPDGRAWYCNVCTDPFGKDCPPTGAKIAPRATWPVPAAGDTCAGCGAVRRDRRKVVFNNDHAPVPESDYAEGSP